MYTTDENGVLNNYATEQNMYFAEYPNQEQQRQYRLQAAYATLIVATLISVAFSVS
ncbi:MAG: ssl1498 family light-harvesting-like protein [Cyanobacteria bacterium J06632_19]